MNQDRWTAVKDNDSTADGTFYYGVKTTAIFCLPSCKSKLPLKKNVLFFDSYEQAIHSGFRPCKRCRPDLYPDNTPNQQLLTRIKDFLDENYTLPQCVNGLTERFGISSSHLVRIFKNKFGLTPNELVRTNRVKLAERLLLSSQLKTIDIALRCGFSSYTTFFTNFKKTTGMTPGKYRKGGNL